MRLLPDLTFLSVSESGGVGFTNQMQLLNSAGNGDVGVYPVTMIIE